MQRSLVQSKRWGYGDGAFICSAMQHSLARRKKCTVTGPPLTSAYAVALPDLGAQQRLLLFATHVGLGDQVRARASTFSPLELEAASAVLIPS